MDCYGLTCLGPVLRDICSCNIRVKKQTGWSIPANKYQHDIKKPWKVAAVQK
jgi:hypothetical protein